MAPSSKKPARSRKPSPRAAKSTPAKPKPSRTRATLVSSKLSYRGKVFNVYTDTVLEPGATRPNTRDIIRHQGSVVILAVDASTNPADPSILIERQYRHAAGQFLLELPAGRIEPKEAPLAAARRELIEETGFRARRWSRHVRYFASPGFLGESMHVFLAQDIYPGTARPEPDELIEVRFLPLSTLLSLIETGKILDAKTILSVLLFASRHRP